MYRVLVGVLRMVTYGISCIQLCDAMDYSPLGSSVHGISKARILERVSISYSRALPNPGIEPISFVSPAVAGGLFTTGST